MHGGTILRTHHQKKLVLLPSHNESLALCLGAFWQNSIVPLIFHSLVITIFFRQYLPKLILNIDGRRSSFSNI
jgi:hypothetical protein